MRNTYIVIIVLVLILGVWFFVGRSKKLEAPTVNEQSVNVPNTTTTPVQNPAIPAGGTSAPLETTNPNAGKAPVKEFTISGQNFSFTPSTITVNKGDKVKITFNNTSGFHNFVIDAFGVATPQKASPDTEILEFTADKAGSFEYYCSVGSHRAMGMKGTLIVK